MLGLTVNSKEQTLSEIKKNEVLAMQRPTDVSGLRRFLRLVGCFRQFIKIMQK